MNGFRAFEQTWNVSGFPPDVFENLYQAEARNFWFRVRNDILLWAIDRFFPNVLTMLEIGCGTGFVLEGIATENPGIRLYGSELFPQGLEFASQRLGNRADLFQFDARNIPFVDEFDIIGAFDVLEHIEQDALVLAQMQQAVVAGGGVIITVPQHPWMWSRMDEIAEHERRYTVRDLTRKMEAAGFECVYSTSFVSLLLPVMMLSRFKRIKDAKAAIRQLVLPDHLNKLFYSVMKFEHRLIRFGYRFPFGGSLLMIGRLPAE